MGLFDLFKSKNDGYSKPVQTGTSKPHVMEIKVTGVTYDNIQATLKKIEEKQKPFNKVLNVEFNGVEADGKTAIEVLVNKCMVGYVPEKRVNEFMKHMEYGMKIKNVYCSHFFADDVKKDIYYIRVKVEFAK